MIFLQIRYYANFGTTALHAENEKLLTLPEQINPLPKYTHTINMDYFSDFGSKAVNAGYYKNLTVKNEIPHALQKPPLPLVEESYPQEISPPEDNLTKNADHENIEELLELNKLHAIFEPINKATLSAQISSPIIKINKLMGESFDSDEILIQLDDTVYQAYLSKWESALAKASTVLHAKQQLFQDGVSSLFDIKEAEAAVAAANAEVTLAKNQIQCCKIRGPYHGKVASLSIQTYELPQVGQALIDIIGDQILIAHFLFDASNLSKISLNQPMDILVKETGQKIQAKIIRIGAVIDPASSTVKVDAEIDNHDLNLVAGMTGYASLIDVSTSFIDILKDFYSEGPQHLALIKFNKIKEPIIKDHSIYLKGLTPKYEEGHKIHSIEDSSQLSDALNEYPNQDNLNDAINVDSIKTSLNLADDDPLGRSLISQTLSEYPNDVQIAPDQHFFTYNALEENPSLNLRQAVPKGALEYKFPESLPIEQPYGSVNNVSAFFHDVKHIDELIQPYVHDTAKIKPIGQIQISQNTLEFENIENNYSISLPVEQPYGSVNNVSAFFHDVKHIDELIQPYVHDTAKIKPIGQFQISQNTLEFENIENNYSIEDMVIGQKILEEDEIQSQEEYVQTIMTLYQEEIVHTSKDQTSTDNESEHKTIEEPIIRDHEVFIYGLLPHHEIVFNQLNKHLEILIPVSRQTPEIIKSPAAEKGISPIETQKLLIENIQNGRPKEIP